MNAKTAGIIAVANSSGTNIVSELLASFVTTVSNIPGEKISTVAGYTQPPVDARANPVLIEQARLLGKQIVSHLV
ncbi:MAG: hypothetical protein Q8P44_00265 [Dehalococcoidia bacterium]|nr:hypothetical protein [Dehalococcoidia bacterium]